MQHLKKHYSYLLTILFLVPLALGCGGESDEATGKSKYSIKKSDNDTSDTVAQVSTGEDNTQQQSTAIDNGTSDTSNTGSSSTDPNDVEKTITTLRDAPAEGTTQQEQTRNYLKTLLRSCLVKQTLVMAESWMTLVSFPQSLTSFYLRLIDYIFSRVSMPNRSRPSFNVAAVRLANAIRELLIGLSAFKIGQAS